MSGRENSYEVIKWMEYAENDYNLARFILYGEYSPKPYNTICNLCQQSAEKAVKALILSFGMTNGLPRSHDIRFLLNQITNILKSEKNIIITDEINLIAATLSEYAVETRYPTDDEITDGEAALCVSYNEKMLLWAKNIIEIQE